MNNYVDKIRILFVIDGMEFGGGERGFVQLAAGLRDRYQLFVAAMPGGRFEQQIKELGIKFCPVNMSRRFSLKPIRRIKEIIRNNKIELVHSQGARADFFARIAGRIAGAPHIICTVAMPVEGFDVGLLQKKIYCFIDQLTERYVERFIVVSDSLRQMLMERRRISAHRVVRVYNGIELSQYHPDAQYGNLRQEWGIPQDVPVVGAIERMVWQKSQILRLPSYFPHYRSFLAFYWDCDYVIPSRERRVSSCQMIPLWIMPFRGLS